MIPKHTDVNDHIPCWWFRQRNFIIISSPPFLTFYIHNKCNFPNFQIFVGFVIPHSYDCQRKLQRKAFNIFLGAKKCIFIKINCSRFPKLQSFRLSFLQSLNLGMLFVILELNESF